MRILVLGGDGMLGHRLVLRLAGRHGVAFTLRGETVPEVLPAGAEGHTGIDVRDLGRLADVFAAVQPQAVVNCVGLVKQRPLGQDVVAASEINAVAPHRVASLCRAVGARFVNISTDCVFSGARGNYTEQDMPDPPDVYGMTKLLGEVTGPGCITLRTSMIGREIKHHLGLLDWFLAQKGPVRGFRRAVFSGLTAVELARVIESIVVDHPQAEGLYHLSAAPISKHDLLHILAKWYAHPIPIVSDDTVAIDRSLDSSRLRAAFGYRPPEWDEMVGQAWEEEKAIWC